MLCPLHAAQRLPQAAAANSLRQHQLLLGFRREHEHLVGKASSHAARRTAPSPPAPYLHFWWNGKLDVILDAPQQKRTDDLMQLRHNAVPQLFLRR